ncbi:extracellular solute-binding protein [Cutibacterium sp. WCA-380-WT-3A]|uniref:Extracellular solute-binding protein n=1 Tax=Cutibacterium porci TaxID=2605781 RepID=A0A7K0J4H3_9ACTN|nr:extracellular solute-binding protein [Cutibacterium porci]MSS44827.1 extracellular solute-binding protein [Cutibacterium porci]
MTRRRLALVTAGVLVTSMAACSQASSPMAPPSFDNAVDVWHRMSMAPGLPSLENAGDEYQRRNPGVNLNVHAISATTDTYLTMVESAVAAGKGPCMAQVPEASVEKLAHDGVLQDVTQFAEQYRDKYDRGPMSRVSYQGRTYGLPLDTSPLVLFYDSDAWAAAHVAPPSQWSELRAAAAVLASSGKAITDMPVQDAGWLAAMSDATGSPWFTPVNDTTWHVGIDSDGMHKLADELQQMVGAKQIILSRSWESVHSDFASGKIVGHIGAPGDLPDLKAVVGAGQHHWKIATIPPFDGHDARVPSYRGSSWVIMKGCKAPKEALDFADELDGQPDLLTERGLIPAGRADKMTTPASLRGLVGDEDIVKDLAGHGRTIADDSSVSPVWDEVAAAWSPSAELWASKTKVSTTLPALAATARSALAASGLKSSGR